MRLKLLSPGEMSAEQKETYDEAIAGKRGAPPAPMMAWLNSPDMARHATRLGEQLRFNTIFPAKLSEIAILVTARHWTSHYEWYAHRRAAQTAGLSQSIIDAVAAGRRPSAMAPEETAVYDFVSELLTTKQVSDATFKAAKDRFGERGVVDLIGVSGYYQLVSMLLNVDRYPLPDGVQPELKPLR